MLALHEATAISISHRGILTPIALCCRPPLIISKFWNGGHLDHWIQTLKSDDNRLMPQDFVNCARTSKIVIENIMHIINALSRTLSFIHDSRSSYRECSVRQWKQCEMDKSRSDYTAGSASNYPHSDEVRRRAAEAETETFRLRWNKRNEIAQAEIDTQPRRKVAGSPSVSAQRDSTPSTDIGFRSRNEEQASKRRQARTVRVAEAGRIGSVVWVPRP